MLKQWSELKKESCAVTKRASNQFHETPLLDQWPLDLYFPVCIMHGYRGKKGTKKSSKGNYNTQRSLFTPWVMELAFTKVGNSQRGGWIFGVISAGTSIIFSWTIAMKCVKNSTTTRYYIFEPPSSSLLLPSKICDIFFGLQSLLPKYMLLFLLCFLHLLD